MISCDYRFPLTNLNIEDAVNSISNGRLDIYSNGSYFEKIYKLDNESYFEIPQLPGGFFLYYSLKDEYPILAHVKRFRDDNSWKGDIFNIECIYFYENTFIVQSNNLYYKVFYNIGSYAVVNNLDDKVLKTYIFTPMQAPSPSGWFSTNTGLFYFLSGNKINGHKIFLNGIYKFEIGLGGDSKTYHVWGESVYGFFDINMDTLELVFPEDLSLYKSKANINNIIVSKDYKSKIYDMIENRKRIKIFDEMHSSNSPHFMEPGRVE